MKFEIDDIKRKAIASQVFSRTALLKHIDPNIDGNFKTSFAFLNGMCEGEPESLRDRVIATHSRIGFLYSGGNPFVTPSYAICHFIWGRIYVWAYYFMHNDSLWQQHILPLMMELQKSAKIKEDMHTAEKLMDAYFEQQRKYEEALQKTPLAVPSSTETSTSQREAHTPDIVQIMQDINNGNIRYVDVDWELQIKTMLKLCSLMPTKFPYVIWLWGLLGEIEDPTIRMDIIGKMQDAAPKCFENPFEAKTFIDDCDCIYKICMQARAYNLRNDIGIRHWWSGEQKCLNDLAHILSDKVVDPKFMVAIAEELYSSMQNGEKHQMLTIVLRANRNIGNLTINNIVDFAKNLYIAEGFRHLILSGEEDYRDIPPLAEFEPKLLKACFEEYIRLRNLEIKDIIEQDLTHCGDAEELECLEYLLKEESQHVNRENMLEDFRGSAAYNAMWYPGRQKVLDMINVFVKYLNNKIKKIKKEEARLGIRDINVQGDYIAGDKHVGTHIDNVESGGIGTQTTKE